MDVSDIKTYIAQLEKENRILTKKLARSEENRALLEETLATHWVALRARNLELEESRELIRQSEAKYRILAHHDLLTGLPNRIFFEERLTQHIHHAKETQTSVALFYLDLDLFKNINDTYGHETGDKALQEIAHRLRFSVRLEDTVARIGGDEFVIILGNLTYIEYAKQIAEIILSNVAKPFSIAGITCEVGTSIGISLYPQDDGDVTTLLEKADLAMYDTKKSGRHGYRFYHEINSKSLTTRSSQSN